MAKHDIYLPNLETQRDIANALELIAKHQGAGLISDYTNAPGSKVLMAGERDAGLYDFVQPWEFGKIEGNPDGQQDFNGANLAIAIGLTQGTAQNINVPWFKFSMNGEIYFVPLQSIRYSTGWNAIYNAGAVYGDDTIGVNPPGGRAGQKISVDGNSNSFIVDSANSFLYSGAQIASVGDTIVARGFANGANNGEFVVSAISETAITVNGSLVTEPGGRNSVSVYKKGTEVRQDAEVVAGGNRFKVQLLKGASQDPLNSYNDSDRDLAGGHNEWEKLIMPTHEKAKLRNWAYPGYVGEVEDWGIGLTDRDLLTHNRYGYGSYSWTQETSDVESFRRVVRGGDGASYGNRDNSWYTDTNHGWRPALRLLS